MHSTPAIIYVLSSAVIREERMMTPMTKMVFSRRTLREASSE